MHLCRASAGRLLGAAAAEAFLLLSVKRLSSEASCRRHKTHVLTGIVVSYSVSRPERLGLRICSSCPDLTCLAANSSAFLHPWLVCHAIASAVCQLWMLCLAYPDQTPCTISHPAEGVSKAAKTSMSASSLSLRTQASGSCMAQTTHQLSSHQHHCHHLHAFQ